MRGSPRALSFAVGVLVAACRGGAPALPALAATGGTFQDGSGRAGLAVLATLRDVEGDGPSEAWNVTLRDPSGLAGQATYARAGAGSYEILLFPAVAPSDTAPYQLAASRGDATVSTSFATGLSTALARPALTFAADASRVEWSPVPGAASYACRVRLPGGAVRETVSRDPGCDVSALPPGAYAASVLALGADVVALASNPAPIPALPARFDVSETTLAFVRPDPAVPALAVDAAGGAFDDGVGSRTLAVWLSIRSLDGLATPAAWDVSVVGPGLPADAPLRFTYGANLPRQLVWSRAVPATQGTYFVTASGTGGSVFATFTLGDPPTLPFVLDAAAAPLSPGSARVTWTAVTGARAYLVSAWERATGGYAAGFWTTSSPASFPDGSFTPGVAYDAYVAATDADMSGATVPGPFSVSEYAYLPGGFVAQ